MDAREAGRGLLDTFREAKITLLAAGVAFYAFLSVIPLLLLVLAVGSAVGEEAFAQRIVSLLEDQLSAEGAAVIEEAVTNPAGRQGASIVGIVALTWSGLRVFRGIDLAFDEVYRWDGGTSIVQQVIDGLTVLVTVGLAIVLMLGLGTLLGQPGVLDVPYVGVLGWVFLVVGLIVVFLPFYYVMPPIDVTAAEALPGTIAASVGWIVLQIGFQIYAANAGQYQAYGFLGAIFLFMLWLYFGSVLVLLGAAINAVLGGYAQSE